MSTRSSPVVEAELEDLEGELRVVRRKSKRHLLWALLGISPGALIPALGLMLEGSEGLLALLVVLVVLSQLYLGVKAASKINGLKKTLRKLREERNSVLLTPATPDRGPLDDPSRDA